MTSKKELRDKIILALELIEKPDALDIVSATGFPVHEVYAELHTLSEEGIVERNYLGLRTWYTFVRRQQDES